MPDFLFILILFSKNLHGQINQETALLGALQYLIDAQIDSTITGIQYKGEWPVTMELTDPMVFMGKEQKAQDSNCFTVSAIHNFLSEIYLRDSSLSFLAPTISKAYYEVISYQTNQEFNFWKAFPSKNGKHWVRRPTNFELRSNITRQICNISNDADDTSQGNLAKWYHHQMAGTETTLAAPELFENFVDYRRQNRNWYNYLGHTPKNSKAYLTWLSEEYQFGFWTPIHGLLSVLGLPFPFSSSYPTKYQPVIPWGANDVDPVVNANVLHYLTLTDQFTSNETNQAAIQMITRHCQKGKWHTAGIYYPNSYHLPYVVCRTFRAGRPELREASENVLKFLEASQNEDGSYSSKPWLNDGDIIQSTAYALQSMIDLQAAHMEVNQPAIDKALFYLLTHAKKEDNKIYWPGGVYFGGGTALRNMVIWHSDAYTTAFIANILSQLK